MIKKLFIITENMRIEQIQYTIINIQRTLKEFLKNILICISHIWQIVFRIYFIAMEISSSRPSKNQNKKKGVLFADKKVYWAIQGEDWKVIMLLSLVRKVIIKCKQLLKDYEISKANKFKSINAIVFSNINNSFQIIEPVNRKVQQIKSTLEGYTELRKDMLGYLKIKKRHYFKKSHMAVTFGFQNLEYSKIKFHRQQHIEQQSGDISYLREEEELPMLTKMSKIKSSLMSFGNKQKSMATIPAKTQKEINETATKTEVFIAKQFDKENIKQDNMRDYKDKRDNKDHREDNYINIHNNRDNRDDAKMEDNINKNEKNGQSQYIEKKLIPAHKTQYLLRRTVNKFIQRKNSEIHIFNRINKTIEKCCEHNQVTISLQNFSIFTRNLATLKARLSYFSCQIYQQSQSFQERILSQIALLIQKLGDSILLFQQIVRPHTEIIKHLLSCLDNDPQEFQDLSVNVSSNLQKKVYSSIQKFTEISLRMAEFIKNLTISPYFKLCLQGKAKQISKLLPILTEIRYTSNYLVKQLQNIDILTNRSARTPQSQVKIYEKWRYAFSKKYRSNRGIKKFRIL